MEEKSITALDTTDRVLSTTVAKQHGAEIAKRISDSGNTHPVDDFIKFKYARDAFEAAMRYAEPAALSHLDGEQPYEKFGISAKYRPGYAIYSYEHDSKWSELNSQLVAIKAEMKERETYLKSLKSPVADIETGEIDRPAEIKSSRKESVVISDPAWSRSR